MTSSGSFLLFLWQKRLRAGCTGLCFYHRVRAWPCVYRDRFSLSETKGCRLGAQSPRVALGLSLKGIFVLIIGFWTGPACPFCFHPSEASLHLRFWALLSPLGLFTLHDRLIVSISVWLGLHVSLMSKETLEEKPFLTLSSSLSPTCIFMTVGDTRCTRAVGCHWVRMSPRWVSSFLHWALAFLFARDCKAMGTPRKQLGTLGHCESGSLGCKVNWSFHQDKDIQMREN